MATLNSRMHVSFLGTYTPTVNINLEKAFKLIRTNGKRGALKGLNHKQSHTAAKMFISVTHPKDVPENFRKDFLKMYLKSKIKTITMTKEELENL